MRTTFYLQAEPEWNRWHSDQLLNIKVRRVTQNKPESAIPGSVVIKLTLDIPERAFQPLAPGGVIAIEEESLSRGEDIEVLVGDANA